LGADNHQNTVKIIVAMDQGLAQNFRQPKRFYGGFLMFAWLRGAIGLLLVGLVNSSALAGGFGIREQSAEALGDAFAGVAAGSDGLSAMFWNPATLALHNDQGFVSESNLSLILPYSRAEDGAGFPFGSPDSGNIGELAFVPASYMSYALTDRLTIGNAVNAPFGLVTESDVWKGSLHGTTSDVFTLNVNPNIAYEVNDWITIAAGVQGEYMRVKLTATNPRTSVEVLDVEADDIAFGFTAGVLLQPTETTTIGLGFRSSMDHKLEGSGTYLPAAYVDREVSAAFDTPEMVTFGISQQLGEQWTLRGGVEWANWSRFESLDILSDSGALLATTPEKWDDSWYFSAGAEYAANDHLTLRGGLAYEKSPVPDATRTPRAPDNDRYWLTLGGSYQFSEKMTAHLSYAHVFIEDGAVNLTTPTPLTANFEQSIDIVSLGLTRDW
jgi:long-chain fatty acid transport protein